MTDTLDASVLSQQSNNSSSLSLSQSITFTARNATGSQQQLNHAGLHEESDPLLQSMITSSAVGEAMSASVADISTGFLQLLTPQLSAVTYQLAELQSSQEMLLHSIQDEVDMFRAFPELQTVTDTLAKVPAYQQKLINIRREMLAAHEKMSRLKKRAAKLKERREEDEAKEQLTRQKELEKEKQLMAKPAESLLSTAAPVVDDTPAATIAVAVAPVATAAKSKADKEKTKTLVNL